MNLKLAGAAIILAASLAVTSAAQKGGKKGSDAPAGGVTITPSAPAKPAVGNIEEGQKVAEIQAVLAAGEFDKAVEAANTYLKTARDDTSKTEAFRIIAEAYRKKGDWRQATSAYQRLRERFDKTSADWTKYDAVADILRSSVNGVYQPPGAPSAKAPAAGGQTLADDSVLADALAKLAGMRSQRLKSRAPNVARCTTPQQAVATLAPLAEEARQIFGLSADAPADGPREVCMATGNRLQALGTQIIASLKAKLDRYQPKFANPWSLSNVDKADIKSTQAACKEMAEAESLFQKTLPTMAGKDSWPDQARLQQESTERRANYDQLAREYTAPTYYGGYGW